MEGRHRLSAHDILAPSFAFTRERVGAALRRFFLAKRPSLDAINPLGPDAGDRLLAFALQGKMIRGCLVPLGFALRGSGVSFTEAPECAIQAGAAMELFQSGLLVHDDIMDRDLTRRGSPTIFRQYAEAASRENTADAAHVGEALGICAGDVAYFLAFEILAGLEAAPEAHRAILSLCSRELAAVGIAQMQDVAWGAPGAAASDEEILKMYAHKTGRYSFSLPLMVGGLLAGASPALLGRLEEAGEAIGVLFQIRDDELGLFGDERELGKPVGSDVREGKKTLYYARLLARAGAKDRSRLAGIFGNRASSADDLAYVRDLARDLGAKADVDGRAAALRDRAQSLIGAVSGASEDRDALATLLDYTLLRRQ